MVHFLFIFVPFLMIFTAHFVNVHSKYFAISMLIMIQEHGSCSALILLLTGKFLRNAAKELLSIKTLQSIFERSETVC
uniref:Secreted protein n=1 Tax=Caenorhabditis tropicalis TaxID=1561998 RepID=A0A1I7T6J0_9PELO